MIAVIVIAVVLVIAAWYGAIAYVATQLIRPKRHGPDYWRTRRPFLTPGDAGLSFEEIDLITTDGLHLAAWFIVASESPAKGTLIYLHGVGGSRISTIAGASVFCKHGYNVFAYDSRGAGESEGTMCTYGFYEKEDVRAAIDSLERRPDTPSGRIAVLGKSMGGAIALQAAAVDPRIRCVIAEASFADLESIVLDYQRRILGPIAGLLHRAAMRNAERQARFTAADVSPLHSVRNCTTPVLFIHGANDSLVDSRYSKMLFDAALGPKELWVIPSGGHTDLRTIAGDVYDERRLTFLETYLR